LLCMFARHRPQMAWMKRAVGVLAMLALATADDMEGEEYGYVTCGSVIKLQNERANYCLHSHDIKWGSGSSQQSVTAVEHKGDPNSLWKVTGANGAHCPQGTPVKIGQVIRLTHVQTKRNLHSHQYQSPLSKRQEVSCFGEGGKGDTGDNWIVESRNGGTHWKRDAPVRLQHQDTRHWLQTVSQ